MIAVTIFPWLRDLVRIGGTKIEDGFECTKSQMRLIAEHDCPMRYASQPARPCGGALNGTEHAAFGVWIANSVGPRKTQPVEFCVQILVIGSANDSDLIRAQVPPC